MNGNRWSIRAGWCSTWPTRMVSTETRMATMYGRTRSHPGSPSSPGGAGEAGPSGAAWRRSIRARICGATPMIATTVTQETIAVTSLTTPVRR